MDEPVVLITGSRKGIGRALSRHFAAEGWQVVGCSRSEPDESLENYTHFLVDVADETAVVEMFTEVRRKFGRLDHLVNNAGVASMNHSLLTPASTIRRLLETNVLGTFLCCREAAKCMQRRRFGRIVNLSSIAVPLNLEGEAAYVASKAAIEALTRVLAREYAQFGITVNAVGPGPVETDLTLSVPRQKIEALTQRQVVKEMASPADVIAAVEYFLRPDARLISGQILYIGGA